MKKLLTALFAIALLCGCSSSSSTATKGSSTSATSSSSSGEATESVESTSSFMDDDVLDYSDDRFAIKLDSVELGSDSDGQTVLFSHFTFTNNTGEIVYPMNLLRISYFQNGVEVQKSSYGYSADDARFTQPDLQTQIMNGATAQLTDIIVLTDASSPVTITLTYSDSDGKSELYGELVDQETVNLQ